MSGSDEAAKYTVALPGPRQPEMDGRRSQGYDSRPLFGGPSRRP
jgi:hypothetical protein